LSAGSDLPTIRDKPLSDADVQIPVQSVDEARTLLGPLDSNARLIRELHGVSVLVRDGSLRLLGEPPHVHTVQHVLEDSLQALRAGRKLTTQDVAQRLRAGAPPEEGADPATAGAVRAGAIKARTGGQQRYLEAMERDDVVFAVGPAGTGKTYLAVAQAIESMKRGAVRRIVLVRPAVEAGEKLGFLPGDFQAKIDPYLRPMYDALQDLLDPRTRARWLDSDVVEVCPLAYMRGRTLNRAFTILDEAQNTTVTQMLMFLTRLGEGSRMVITGDPSQVDLPANVTSGLADAVRRLQGVAGIGFVELDASDVVRHAVVSRIVGAYGDARNGGRNRPA
jgi:phosphate starvation-inducible PhoH-like protein